MRESMDWMRLSAEDEVPVGGQGAGIGQVITLGGAFTVGVGLVLGLAVYEEPAILKVYFVAGQTDDTFYVLFTGRQTHRDDVAAMVFLDDAEIESQLAIVPGWDTWSRPSRKRPPPPAERGVQSAKAAPETL